QIGCGLFESGRHLGGCLEQYLEVVSDRLLPLVPVEASEPAPKRLQPEYASVIGMESFIGDAHLHSTLRQASQGEFHDLIGGGGCALHLVDGIGQLSTMEEVRLDHGSWSVVPVNVATSWPSASTVTSQVAGRPARGRPGRPIASRR